MIPVLGVALLIYCFMRGGNPLGLGLIAVGVGLHLLLALRLARASAGGVGGHAEWVRDVSLRPRMRRSPAWLVGSVLVAVGAAVALFLR